MITALSCCCTTKPVVSRQMGARASKTSAAAANGAVSAAALNAQTPAASSAAGAAPTVGTDTVHVLYEPATGTPTCDVLFFHGLQPVSYDQAWEHTWENDNDPKVLWPKEWLGKVDFPTARVMSICYDSRALLGQKDMDEIGNILVNEICLLAKVGQDRPVVLVGHSLGGLVLKKLALQAKKEAGLEGNSILREPCKALCANLAGTFFYATPHGGANLGSFAEWALGSVGAGGPVLKYLTVFSDKGAELNRDFTMTFPTLCFMALVETLQYKVVAEGSAIQGMHNYVLMKADHISICKPKSTSNGSYRYLKEYLTTALDNFQKRKQVRQEAQQQVLQLSTLTGLELSREEDALQTRYTKEVQPALNWIKEQKKQLEKSLGDRWAEGLFPPDKKVGELEVTKYREVTRDFWRHVLRMCDRNVLDEEFFKTANMAGRAKEYRLLVEPIDIANWYHANFHLPSHNPNPTTVGHYIDGIDVELDSDNHRRPSRYRKLQRIEQRVVSARDNSYTAPSSLGLARLLKERVGDLEWAQYNTQPEPADAGPHAVDQQVEESK